MELAADFADQEDAQEQKRSTETAQDKSSNLLSGGSTKAKKQTREQCDEAYLKADHEAHVDSLVDAAEGWDSYGWEFVCEEKGITVTRASIPNSSLKYTKGVAVFKAPPKRVFDIVRNIDIYKRWDSKVIESKLIRTVSEKISINYLEFAPFFPVSGRDACFLQYITKRGKSFVVSWHSVSDVDAPKKKGIVRAKMGPSGFVISPLQNHSLVTFVLKFDLKGWIPPHMINLVSSSQPMMLLACVEDELKKMEPITPSQPEEPEPEPPLMKAKWSTPKSSRHRSETNADTIGTSNNTATVDDPSSNKQTENGSRDTSDAKVP